VRASEVISELQKLVEEHGDLPVHVYDTGDPPDLMEANDIDLGESYWDDSPVFTITS